MKKGLCVFIFSFLCVIYLFSPLVYGLVEYKDTTILTEESDVFDIVDSIMVELSKISETETLKFTFPMKLSESTDKSAYAKSVQSKVIERLDAINTITPSVKTSIRGNEITFEIVKYVPSDIEYYNELNSLVESSKTLKTDLEKVYLLGNYFYTNGFKYAHDNAVEFGHIKSSCTYQNLNAMPDSVIERKKAICMGFANVGSEYLTEIGIPNVKIRGHHTVDGGYHVWNIAYFEYNGKTDWYCVDYGYSIYRMNSPKVVKTLDAYVKEDKYVWEETLLDDAIYGKYNKDLTLKTFNTDKIEKSNISLLEYSKTFSFLSDIESVRFITSKDLFNLALYFTNIYDKMIIVK